MSRRRRLSARDVERLLKKPLIFPGLGPSAPIAIGQGSILCPHCGEPVPIRVIVKHMDMVIEAPSKKKMRGG